ncbi:PIG-L family deacetylase [Pedobacter hartonius]|uniref:N-acetylglucosaminyl deacetylase, LmbE family n=1 Tax=Pedobacter hartonius TaxID=425514 RepID=A0A1H3X8S7_9SPHI|nr:PIG-L family deacetylase [Pedobacter hartonius]SDZ95331.1 N-acetylglucosaminyl deacetylase, LmbE family [Pedobacter hartonius]
MNYRLSFLCLFSFAPFFVKAQASVQLNAAEIRQGLASLNVTGSVLYIAAHPDDENTRLLTYLSKEKKVRTGYLSLTRGDGGQNLIGTEQGELLGLIRTQELLAARRMDGAEQFFTRANDFGFSKTSAESFKIWGKEQILSDVVWVIRNFRPDVIITRFPEDARAGHGHHQASAILAREAFSAAADPKRFPEQLKYVKVWQAKRIVWNTFNFGSGNTTADDQLKLDVGLFNPLLGKSYGEIAAQSRSNHKSQGFGASLQRGSSIEFFSPVAGDVAKNDLFEGLNFNLDRDKGTGKVQQLLNAINAAYDPADPSKSIPALLQLKEEAKTLPFKQEKLDELILACAGIWIETTVPEATYALNDSISVLISAISRVKNDFPLEITLQDIHTHQLIKLPPNQMVTQTAIITGSSVGITQPYWLKKTHPTGSYMIDSLSHLGRPEASAPHVGTFRVSFGKQFVDVTRPVVYKHTDPVRGELYQPLVVAPPVTVTMAEKSYVFTNNNTRKIAVQLQGFKDKTKGVLNPKVPEGWKVSPEKINFDLEKKGMQQHLEFTLTPAGSVEGGEFSIWATVDGKTYNQGLKVLSYDHIPVQTLFPFAAAKVEKADLKFAGMNIGYIAGAGDLIPESLRQVGYHVTLLTENQVTNADLSVYDAVITGVRLYNISEHMNAIQPKLMDYVKNGGVLLVQYNVNGTLKLDDIGPYPFKVTRDRVTDEDARVTFLAPDDAALNFPNKITAKDFTGWIQERGLYFAGDIDAHYTPVLGMNDTGEQSSNGALLVAPYGKGKFVYTSLAFFRELPAGVPGAYRLFVNLISSK